MARYPMRTSVANTTVYTRLCAEDLERLNSYCLNNEQTISQVLRQSLVKAGIIASPQEIERKKAAAC